ncbi:Menaquinone reductase, multiheme cytochrome c subunit [bacterium HR09]|nr:Menaquinone reductase, multiheme cytochrome c subunit [bacterium HR09]
MTSRLVSWVLGVAVAGSWGLWLLQVRHLRLPGNDVGYEPDQPIAFSHRLHAGELAIDCLYCHFGAERSRHAGIPAASVCMNCHRFVTAPLGAVRAEEAKAKKEGRAPGLVVSPELAKLYRALGLNEKLQPEPGAPPQPIAWVRVHRLPDFVYFDHRPHVLSGVTCQTCHGPVETMERLRQASDLTMGWCVNCHRTPREVKPGTVLTASVDCAVCHF